MVDIRIVLILPNTRYNWLVK